MYDYYLAYDDGNIVIRDKVLSLLTNVRTNRILKAELVGDKIDPSEKDLVIYAEVVKK
ncbi:MAG: hypothetical protein ACOX4I_00345 [Anaerovoracaceae bacterium]|jgi:hypothetical protein